MQLNFTYKLNPETFLPLQAHLHSSSQEPAFFVVQRLDSRGNLVVAGCKVPICPFKIPAGLRSLGPNT